MTEGTDVRGPGEALSSDEETCLLILAEGGYMAPIGRWAGPLESLTQRGLAKMLDAANYVVTDHGMSAARKKDTEFYSGWIEESNAAVLARAGRSPQDQSVFVGENRGPGRSTDEVDDLRPAEDALELQIHQLIQAIERVEVTLDDGARRTLGYYLRAGVDYFEQPIRVEQELLRGAAKAVIELAKKR